MPDDREWSACGENITLPGEPFRELQPWCLTIQPGSNCLATEVGAGTGSGSGRLGMLWRFRLLRLLLLLLPLLLLLLFLRDVMSDGATGRGAHQCVMAGYVSRYGADGSAFDATFCRGSLRPRQQSESEQQRGESLYFQWCFPRHAILPGEHAARLRA